MDEVCQLSIDVCENCSGNGCSECNFTGEILELIPVFEDVKQPHLELVLA